MFSSYCAFGLEVLWALELLWCLVILTIKWPVNLCWKTWKESKLLQHTGWPINSHFWSMSSTNMPLHWCVLCFRIRTNSFLRSVSETRVPSWPCASQVAAGSTVHQLWRVCSLTWRLWWASTPLCPHLLHPTILRPPRAMASSSLKQAGDHGSPANLPPGLSPTPAIMHSFIGRPLQKLAAQSTHQEPSPCPQTALTHRGEGIFILTSKWWLIPIYFSLLLLFYIFIYFAIFKYICLHVYIYFKLHLAVLLNY